MKTITFTIGLLMLIGIAPIFSEDAAVAKAKDANLLWLCVAAFLVFFMQAGFAYIEAGFTRSKNTVNILMKNLADFCIGSIFFWVIGFSIMFGPQLIKDIGIGHLTVADAMLWKGNLPDNYGFGFFLFQLVFCGTSATIVSGAMAERTRFRAYVFYSVVISALIYPIFGSFAWSNLFDTNNLGWLAKLGFIDFAGSTVVHSIGAWVGLAGTIVLGPRIGKFAKDGTVTPLLGHNLSMATLGAFILWFGWFGFNPGSTGVIDGGGFAYIAVTTNMAAAAGGISAVFISWLLFRSSDLTMMINGVLGGLVAITAPCNDVTVTAALVIGAVAGIIAVLGVLLLDKLRIDDPVGAISVHGFAGAWGTLAIGLFAHPELGSKAKGLFYGGGFHQLWVQFVGVGSAFIWAFGSGLLLFIGMKYTLGLRVDEHEEIEGLDILEHGLQAYPDEIH